MSATTREDHAAIWLQPECCAGYEGRLWCEHDEPVVCDEGESWTKYVRADRLERTEALLREAAELIERLTSWAAIAESGKEIEERHPQAVRNQIDDVNGARAFLDDITIRELLEGDDD